MHKRDKVAHSFKIRHSRIAILALELFNSMNGGFALTRMKPQHSSLSRIHLAAVVWNTWPARFHHNTQEMPISPALLGHCSTNYRSSSYTCQQGPTHTKRLWSEIRKAAKLFPLHLLPVFRSSNHNHAPPAYRTPSMAPILHHSQSAAHTPPHPPPQKHSCQMPFPHLRRDPGDRTCFRISKGCPRCDMRAV